jgi:hypothetical protein
MQRYPYVGTDIVSLLLSKYEVVRCLWIYGKLYISLMKWKVVIIHTVHRTEIPRLDSWVAHIPSVKRLCP